MPTPSPGPDRPNTNGTVAAYTGTLSETDTNNVIGANPVSTTQSGSVSVKITTGSNTAGNTVYTAAETDALQLQTLSSTTTSTVAFQAASNGQTDVRALQTTETDSTGATFTTTYGANNGLETVIPEQTGTFSNDAKETYTESDPGVTIGASGQQTTITRNVNADGSYTESVAISILGVANQNYMMPDYSAQEELLAFGGGYKFAAPAAGSILYSFYPTTTPTSTTLSNTPEFGPNPIPDWIPSSQTTPSTETDTIATGTVLDARCPSTGSYTYAPNLVKQVLTTVDSALGTVETRTTQSFDVAGAGSVCVTVDDAINGFYDYTGQEGPTLLIHNTSATKPITTITMSEVIGLQSINGSTALAKARAAAAAVKGATPVVLPRSVLLASVEHRVHLALLRRMQAARAAQGASK